MSTLNRTLGRFPLYRQRDAMDCGPTCLMMIAAHYGKHFTLPFLREASYINREGVSAAGITAAAEKIGLNTNTVKIPFEAEAEEGCLQNAPLPCIVHWNQKHFVVVHKVTKKSVWVADPAQGKFKLPLLIFEKSWVSDKGKGIAILFETTPEFYDLDEIANNKLGFTRIFEYIKPHRFLVVQLLLGMVLSSLLGLFLPFLTQSIIDTGIATRNYNFIALIFAGQIIIFLGNMYNSFIQTWILTHIGTRINVSLISDFLSKLMKLPLGFFDSKMTGDLMQRIGDQSRIELFLTHSTLNIVLSVFNFVLYSFVMLYYNVSIYVIFLVASTFYFIWISVFLKYRRDLDYKKFQQLSNSQSNIIELIQGMPEIKLQGIERKKRAQWLQIQAKTFTLNLRALALGQWQDAGAGFINQTKDILISFIAVRSVMDGNITLGMYFSVQFLVGQLNAPLQQFIGFIRSAQDAKISLERLNEVQNQPNEDELIWEKPDDKDKKSSTTKEKTTITIFNTLVPKQKDIVLENLHFQYSPIDDLVLKKVNATIPHGKVTAIVGASGSGKTTLVKLLLGFYRPTKGAIKIGNTPLITITPSAWRAHCGAVMQDGFIFSESIAENIAAADTQIDLEKLLKAVQIASIQEFIENLPLTYNTKIGPSGNGISGGQKQRMLIARAIYKNPDFLFFDEATNALDATNERTIVENLAKFFENRTVVVVAHRLSTVKKADQILVLKHGEIVERGTHTELVAQNGAYLALIKDQLELGN